MRATEELIERGPVVVPSLLAAAQSDDPEVAYRARKALTQLKGRSSRAVITAAIRLLVERNPAGTVEGLFDFAASADEDAVLDAARAGLAKLAAGARSSSSARARTSTPPVAPSRPKCLFKAETTNTAANSGRCCKTATGSSDTALPAHTRCADPIGVPVLIALLDRTDAAAEVAEAFLFELAGETAPDAVAGGATGAREGQQLWQRWWGKHPGGKGVFGVPVRVRVERFIMTAENIKGTYRGFVYESTLPGCKAAVRNRRLVLRGDHPEGDQRLLLPARTALKRAEWPGSLDVTVQLGGTAGNNFGWHTGVSVGRLKLLIHTGVDGGAFRAEDVHSHVVLFNNQNLGFTPAVGIAHRMTIRVRQTAAGYRFEVTVEEGGAGRGKFQKTFAVPRERIGKLETIGLERSGRQGGDAFFDGLTIKHGAE